MQSSLLSFLYIVVKLDDLVQQDITLKRIVNIKKLN